ncbi:MAG: TIGR01212 family radical SAM protein [Bacteroidetes bacterium RBG_13_46_8]|nr:MAG: TIGR01212 family radical SAM protein [Bacteroidetes bacterium RBG_13_46_8]
MSYPWGNTRRFNSYAETLKKLFGSRIQKVTIDAGFTCPNRDGSRGQGGCTFCLNDAFNPSYCDPKKSIRQQIEAGMEFHTRRYRRATRYLAYFQAYSNTYGPVEYLKPLYEEALSVESVAGLVIGTRPDCMDDKKLEYFESLSRKTYLVIEYGVESVYNRTLLRINRGHTFADSVKAIKDTASRGIRTGCHMIIGLPGETTAEILGSAEVLSSLPLYTVKFHQLQIFKGTKMENEFAENPRDFHLFSPDEYLVFMAEYITRLNPSFIIERIAGETPPRFAAVNRWGPRYDEMLVKFERLLEEKDYWQGKAIGNRT